MISETECEICLPGFALYNNNTECVEKDTFDQNCYIQTKPD